MEDRDHPPGFDHRGDLSERVDEVGDDGEAGAGRDRRAALAGRRVGRNATAPQAMASSSTAAVAWASIPAPMLMPSPLAAASTVRYSPTATVTSTASAPSALAASTRPRLTGLAISRSRVPRSSSPAMVPVPSAMPSPISISGASRLNVSVER